MPDFDHDLGFGNGCDSKTESAPAADLDTLHRQHQGKVSVKWPLYLRQYHRVLQPLREHPLRILEIGVQNGGSLEIWAKYFPKAERIIGCDIEAGCANLRFSDPRISVYVGDAGSQEIAQRIAADCPGFDLVVDDGSHHSLDLLRNWWNYYPLLRPGGVYIAEDLHCCYWASHGGGLAAPQSAMVFFKRLADWVNRSHWGIDEPALAFFQEQAQTIGRELSADLFEGIATVTFMDSVCIVQKADEPDCRLGPLLVAGQDESVVPGRLALKGAHLPRAQEPANAIGLRSAETRAYEIAQQMQQQAAQLEAQAQQLASQASQVDVLQGQLLQIRQSRSWRYLSILKRLLGRGPG